MKLNKRVEKLISLDKDFDDQQDKLLRKSYLDLSYETKGEIDQIFLCLTGHTLGEIMSIKTNIKG